jgi:hypothetical protein
MLTFENEHKARERSKEVQEIEYVKNCVVKYLESNDEKVRERESEREKVCWWCRVSLACAGITCVCVCVRALRMAAAPPFPPTHTHILPGAVAAVHVVVFE